MGYNELGNVQGDDRSGSHNVVAGSRNNYASYGGAVIGLGIALLTSRFLEAFLFGVSPLDPATIAGVIGVLGATALLANFVPALRAARVDPARVLKEE